jgi:RHS repeat-associated protein
VSWAASVDNIAVTAYSIERCAGVGCTGSFTEVGTSSDTQFISANLSASSTYRYRVRARDALQNWSAVSELVTATTPAATTITFFHNDVAGTPLVATDTNGDVVWKQNYRPYGSELASIPNHATNHISFAGRQFDGGTGLSYMGARYYDPVLGRFLATDPAGFDAENLHSFNRYAYSNNNPYKFVDPDGHSPIDIAFLAYDLGKLSVALYSGVGVGPAVMDVAFSAIGVVSPVPGTGQAIKAARVVSNGVELAKTADNALETAKVLESGWYTAYKYAGKVGTEAHHSFPKYLGGAFKQEFVHMTTSMHKAFHKGLDNYQGGVLSRRLRKDHFDKLSSEESAKVMKAFVAYTKEFDDKYGTKLYEAFIKNGGSGGNLP